MEVIRTFVHKVYHRNNNDVNDLTKNNTKKTESFEEIREFEQLSEETQETQNPLPDYAESGSCKIEFGSLSACSKERFSWGVVGGRLCLVVREERAVL